MQCMMKEICAQCLQEHKDPVTGEETVVFSCFNQDQPLDHVDFGSLRTRLSQNGAQEKLTKQWIDHCLRISARVGRRLKLSRRQGADSFDPVFQHAVQDLLANRIAQRERGAELQTDLVFHRFSRAIADGSHAHPPELFGVDQNRSSRTPAGSLVSSFAPEGDRFTQRAVTR